MKQTLTTERIPTKLWLDDIEDRALHLIVIIDFHIDSGVSLNTSYGIYGYRT